MHGVCVCGECGDWNPLYPMHKRASGANARIYGLSLVRRAPFSSSSSSSSIYVVAYIYCIRGNIIIALGFDLVAVILLVLWRIVRATAPHMATVGIAANALRNAPFNNDRINWAHWRGAERRTKSGYRWLFGQCVRIGFFLVCRSDGLRNW